MTGTLIITGASFGIGKATAGRFAQEGWRVANLSRSACPLDQVINITTDLAGTDWTDSVRPALASLLDDSRGPVCLVHCAGLLLKDTIQDMTAADLARSLQVNVIAASQLNQLVLPAMTPGSSILYVGSTLGEKAVAGAASYVTSKHAQIGLMRSTCQDLAGGGVHTACICPGFTDTEMLRTHVGQDESILKALAGNVTQGRLIEPAEIADTLWFAAGAPVINGAVIHANLGQIEH